MVGAQSIDKIITVRPERRESLNLGYFTPVFICSLPCGAYELGGPSRRVRTNETEHSGPPKFPDKDCEYHEDTLPRGKERGRDMNYNRSADQRYFTARTVHSRRSKSGDTSSTQGESMAGSTTETKGIPEHP